MDDLAKRQVNVIALTSNPNGVTLAENILQRAKETHPDFTYVNVGYIPGNDAGLRALASGWLPASRQDVNGVPWGATPLGGTVRNMDELAHDGAYCGRRPHFAKLDGTGAAAHHFAHDCRDERDAGTPGAQLREREPTPGVLARVDGRGGIGIVVEPDQGKP